MSIDESTDPNILDYPEDATEGFDEVTALVVDEDYTGWRLGGDDNLLSLINGVLRENKFWSRVNQYSSMDDARQSLWLYFTQHPEKLGNSPAYASKSIRNALRDLLKKESERGLGQVPREVHQSPRKHERDKRRFVLFFSDDDADALCDDEDDTQCDDLYSYSHDPFTMLRAQLVEDVIFEITQQADYQQLACACEAKTMTAKAAAMKCKTADVRKCMNTALKRISADVRVRMGRLAD